MTTIDMFGSQVLIIAIPTPTYPTFDYILDCKASMVCVSLASTTFLNSSKLPEKG